MTRTTRTTLTLLSLSAGLLTACNDKNTPPPVTQPTVGVSQDMAQLSTLTQNASTSLQDMSSSTSTDVNDDLLAVMKLLTTAFPNAPMLSGTLNPAQYGQALLNTVTHQNALSSQALPGDVILPYGTITIAADGKTTATQQPTTGFIVINEQKGTRLDINWHVNGAPSVYLTKNLINTVELPTNATLTATKGTTKIADLSFNMTPGDCLQQRGPSALTLTGWAGQQSNPAMQVNLNYAWTASGITSSGNLQLQSKTRQASSKYDLNMAGTTANRCDLLKFAFTPTSVTASATANLPDQQTEGSLSITGISNLTITPNPLNVTNPFKDITGSLNASLKYNGQLALTAAGPIADGNDLDLMPGDQVMVSYVKNGAVVTKTLPDALKDLFSM